MTQTTSSWRYHCWYLYYRRPKSFKGVPNHVFPKVCEVRSSELAVICRKYSMKNFSILTRKYFCRSLFWQAHTVSKSATLLQRDDSTGVFLWTLSTASFILLQNINFSNKVESNSYSRKFDQLTLFTKFNKFTQSSSRYLPKNYSKYYFIWNCMMSNPNIFLHYSRGKTTDFIHWLGRGYRISFNKCPWRLLSVEAVRCGAN